MTDDHDHKRLEDQVNLVNLIKLICLCICLRFDGSLCWVIWDRWEIFKRNGKGKGTKPLRPDPSTTMR